MTKDKLIQRVIRLAGFVTSEQLTDPAVADVLAVQIADLPHKSASWLMTAADKLSGRK